MESIPPFHDMDKPMNTQTNKDLMSHIAHLETTTNQLLLTLDHCARLLTLVSDQVHDKKQWLKLIDDINHVIQIGAHNDQLIFH